MYKKLVRLYQVKELKRMNTYYYMYMHTYLLSEHI